MAHRFSYSEACGIFLDQGLPLALLCGFLTPGAPGKPLSNFLKAGRTGHSPLLPCQNAIPFFFWLLV